MWSSILPWFLKLARTIKRASFYIGYKISHWALALPVFAALLLEPVSTFRIIILVQQIEQSDPESLLLPDLMTLPPKDLRLVVDTETGHKSIRFSNRILNRGPGDLEMVGQLNADTNTVSVTQIIHGTNLFMREQDTGVFYYHDSHSHWHWEGFSDYKIWSITPSSGLLANMASSAKVGYCLEDVEIFSGNQTIIHVQNDQPVPEETQFNSCYWRRQGLSVGWVDVYRSHVPGQSIDITHLPDGAYALQSTVDPANLILEGNDANNTSLVYFSLRDNRLEALPRPPTPSSLRKLSE